MRGGEDAPFPVVLGRSGGQQGSLRRRFRAKYRERAGGRGRGRKGAQLMMTRGGTRAEPGPGPAARFGSPTARRRRHTTECWCTGGRLLMTALAILPARDNDSPLVYDSILGACLSSAFKVRAFLGGSDPDACYAICFVLPLEITK